VRAIFTTLLDIAGAGLVTAGAALVYHPAGFIVAGGFVLAGSFQAARTAQPEPAPDNAADEALA
jgi:hypothetical protein